MVSGEESTPGCDQVSLCSKEDAGGRAGGGGSSHWALLRSDRVSRSSCIETTSKPPIKTDMELMKEKFAKLLLGEDMSGGGKGVPSALALSNAITNLAASVFSEQRRLEPMPDDRKTRWKKEIDWLLSVTDNIVEMVPKTQQTSNGIQLEIMTTQQRMDLKKNIPVLRKLDAMLLDYLENFKDQNEFRYVSKDSDESEKANTAQRNDEKWWLPIVKVPPEGLSDVSRKWLEFQKESVHKIFKAAMAINAQVLSAMEIPENYIETLPKNGRESLGDVLYKGITVESFDPEQLLSTLDTSTEHKKVELKNRIEASVVIWKRKMHNKEGKSSLSSSISMEKREMFEERAETILVLLKQRFPGIPQSALEVSKIQYNKDVGHSILESYSRILESLAYTVMSLIEDVLYADSFAQNPESKRRPVTVLGPVTGLVKFPNPEEEIRNLNSMDAPSSMTLLDFMGWQSGMMEGMIEAKHEAESKRKDLKSFINRNFNDLKLGKLHKIHINKKTAYKEKLEKMGLKSPSARQ